MSEQIIKSIEIEIAGVTLKVTPEQAKNLHSALGELLNLKTEKVIERETVRDRFIPQPYPVVPFVQPTWIGTGTPFVQPNKWTITSSVDSANACGSVNLKIV